MPGLKSDVCIKAKGAAESPADTNTSVGILWMNIVALSEVKTTYLGVFDLQCGRRGYGVDLLSASSHPCRVAMRRPEAVTLIKMHCRLLLQFVQDFLVY